MLYLDLMSCTIYVCGHNNNKVGLEVGRAGVPVVLFVLLISS